MPRSLLTSVTPLLSSRALQQQRPSCRKRPGETPGTPSHPLSSETASLPLAPAKRGGRLILLKQGPLQERLQAPCVKGCWPHSLEAVGGSPGHGPVAPLASYLAAAGTLKLLRVLPGAHLFYCFLRASFQVQHHTSLQASPASLSHSPISSSAFLCLLFLILSRRTWLVFPHCNLKYCFVLRIRIKYRRRSSYLA